MAASITRDDVEKAYKRSGQSTENLSEEEALTAKLTLLNDLIVQDILVARAPGLKVELTDAELDNAYEEARKNITGETFQQELKRRGLTAADMREGLRRELLSQKVIEREVISKVGVSDQEVNDFFNANKAQFNFPEEAYHIAQIIVTPAPDAQQANQHRRRRDDAAGGGGESSDADEPPQGRRVLRRSGARLLRGSGVGAARRRHGLRADVEAAEGAAGAARCRAEREARDRHSRQRARRSQHRARRRARTRRSARSVSAGRERRHHEPTPLTEGAAAARRVSDHDAHGRDGGQPPRTAAGRVAGQGADAGTCGAGAK